MLALIVLDRGSSRGLNLLGQGRCGAFIYAGQGLRWMPWMDI